MRVREENLTEQQKLEKDRDDLEFLLGLTPELDDRREPSNETLVKVLSAAAGWLKHGSVQLGVRHRAMLIRGLREAITQAAHDVPQDGVDAGLTVTILDGLNDLAEFGDLDSDLKWSDLKTQNWVTKSEAD